MAAAPYYIRTPCLSSCWTNSTDKISQRVCEVAASSSPVATSVASWSQLPRKLAELTERECLESPLSELPQLFIDLQYLI